MRALYVPALVAFACACGGAAPSAPAPSYPTHIQPAAPAAKVAPPPASAPVTGGAPALAVAIPPNAAAEPLRAMLKPYAEATSTALSEMAWDGVALNGIKPPLPDLVLVTGALLQAGCRAQMFVHLDWGALGRDRYLPQATSDCGAGAYLAAVALAWDRDKLALTPRWTDFWDVARYPGGRGLQRVARGNLEIALLADGVSAGDVYRTLRSNDGLDRAFRKLDQLKPYIIWWDKPDQPAQLLGAGRVLMTSGPTASVLRAGEAARRHYGLQWADSLGEVQSWAIVQGAPHPGAAAAALLIVSDIARQATFARASGLGPSTRGAIDLLSPAVKAGSPSAPANLAGSLQIDEGFWLENGAKLAARFAAWASK